MAKLCAARLCAEPWLIVPVVIAVIFVLLMSHAIQL
jgi:hypothetical protein